MSIFRRILTSFVIGLLCSLATAGESVIQLDVPPVDMPQVSENDLDKNEQARRNKATLLHLRMMRRFKEERYNAARQLCEQIVKLIPEDGTAWYNLACAQARLDRHDEAIESLNAALDLGFAAIRHMENDPDLSSLHGSEAFRKLLARREEIHRQRAERIRDELHRRYGEGYIVEVDHAHRLVFATNTDRDTLNALRDDLTARAEALWEQLFDHRLEQYVTIIIPKPGTIEMGRIGGVFRRSDATIVARRVGMTCRHEFTHALHFADIEARAQLHPIWVLEGLATLYETAEFQHGRLLPMPNDRLNALKFFLARDRLHPLRKLLTVDQEGFMEDPAVFYAMSRYLMMYLEENGKLREWYLAYTAAYEEDDTGREALESVFGEDLDAIEEDWLEWVKRLPRPAMAVRTNQPYLGVQVSPATEGLAVQRVIPGSGADEAGLQAGDLIVRVSGRQLADGTELIRLVTAREVGDDVKIRYRRNGRYANTVVTLQAKPARIPTEDDMPVTPPRQLDPRRDESDEQGCAPRRKLPHPLPTRKAA
jgi:tetratricopeptide (TPR) repeat protein